MSGACLIDLVLVRVNAAPLRIDFAGGWLDVPKFSRRDGFIVNVAIAPLVTLDAWPYFQNAGLGGSAAFALLKGRDAIEAELANGVGWQDPAIIMETGLCCWRSGQKPELWVKRNPLMLSDKMALYWTGTPHVTASLVDLPRDMEAIATAGAIAAVAIERGDYRRLCRAVEMSYAVQLGEGMKELPDFGQLACKYVGGGHGGYAVYLFEHRLKHPDLRPVEPYMRSNFSS